MTTAAGGARIRCGSGQDGQGREIEAALGAVRARLDAACRDAGRDPAEVSLLPVTKFFPESDARILYDLGCREFGESREQEATAKIAEFRAAVTDPSVRWHMIGHLQRNKAKAVAHWAYAIHSVDSERLVGALGRAATAALEAGSGPSLCGCCSKSVWTAIRSAAVPGSPTSNTLPRRCSRRRDSNTAG